MFKWQRLATNAAYADQRWNLYGTYRGIITVVHGGRARLVLQ
jgi:hypothetical protein